MKIRIFFLTKFKWAAVTSRSSNGGHISNIQDKFIVLHTTVYPTILGLQVPKNDHLYNKWDPTVTWNITHHEILLPGEYAYRLVVTEPEPVPHQSIDSEFLLYTLSHLGIHEQIEIMLSSATWKDTKITGVVL